MDTDLAPNDAPASTGRSHEPQAVVEAFLDALANGDVAAASELIDDEIHYANRGLPSVRGREEMNKVFDLIERPWSGFEYCNHAISSEGSVVLTERTDVLIAGPLRIQFWVWGRFEVNDGRITLWRDSFDLGDMLRGTARGLAAIVIPSLQTTTPTSPNDVPGR